ncbi:hypothetical protein A2U01_0083850, partial [Trifolium medium]|nr:hypothetical protein [Trifolium medium]
LKLAMSANHGLCEIAKRRSSGNSSARLFSLAVTALFSNLDK